MAANPAFVPRELTAEDRAWLAEHRPQFPVDEEGYFITKTGKRRRAGTLLGLRPATPEMRSKGTAALMANGAEREAKYLENIAKGLRMTEAARKAGWKGTDQVHKLRNVSPEFAEKEKQARIQSTEPVVNALFDAAINGNVPAMTKILDQLDPEQWAPANKKLDVVVTNQLEVNAGDIIDQIKSLMGRIAERRELTEGYIEAEIVEDQSD